MLSREKRPRLSKSKSGGESFADPPSSPIFGQLNFHLFAPSTPPLLSHGRSRLMTRSGHYDSEPLRQWLASSLKGCTQDQSDPRAIQGLVAQPHPHLIHHQAERAIASRFFPFLSSHESCCSCKLDGQTPTSFLRETHSSSRRQPLAYYGRTQQQQEADPMTALRNARAASNSKQVGCAHQNSHRQQHSFLLFSHCFPLF